MQQYVLELCSQSIWIYLKTPWSILTTGIFSIIILIMILTAFKKFIPLRKFVTRYPFSTIAKETENFFVPKHWEIPQQAHLEAHQAISISRSVRDLATILRENIIYITDINLGNLYDQLVLLNLPLDDQFDTKIAPITKQYLKKFNRENAQCIGKIAYALAHFKVRDQQLWGLVIKKLHDQNIYKYLTLDFTVELLVALVNDGLFLNHPIVQKLQTVVVKQNKYYQHFPHLLDRLAEITPKLQQRVSSKAQQKKLGQANLAIDK